MVGARGLEPLTPTVSRNEYRKFPRRLVLSGTFWYRPEHVVRCSWSAIRSAFLLAEFDTFSASFAVFGR